MRPINFVAYSDIHYDNYSNGVTLQDVYNVDAEIRDYIKDTKPDFWLFGGDRFLSRNPYDIVRQFADVALKEKNDVAGKKPSCGIPGIITIGNHDQADKKLNSTHTCGHVKFYPNDLNNIKVLDTCRTYVLNIDGIEVCIHAVPAGQIELYKPDTAKKHDYDICVFHDMLIGSKMTNGSKAITGFDRSKLDISFFDAVIGGDVHTHQDLNFHNTKAFYIGAPMQHNWGDKNDIRGFIHVTLDKQVVNLKHIESRSPKFKDFNIQIDKIEDLLTWVQASKSSLNNNVIKIVIQTSNLNLSGIKISQWQDKLTEVSGARQIKLITRFINTTIQTQQTAKPDTIEWQEYVAATGINTAGLDTQVLINKGLEFIQKY